MSAALSDPAVFVAALVVIGYLVFVMVVIRNTLLIERRCMELEHQYRELERRCRKLAEREIEVSHE